MENVKISIIVPVYQVEPYLRKCLDSIINQTYRNLEIILVEDGSPDHCGAICDEYAAEDERIKVIHKENGGVASARNAGLSLATGDYIGWVDSDDWIEPEMFETMLAAAVENNADIAICSREECYPPNHRIQMGWQKMQLLNKEQAIALLVEDDLVRSYLWDKLWKREIFQGVKIPQLSVFEDMAVMYQLFARAERVVCLPNVFYHYEHYGAGLTTATSLQSRMDFYQITEDRREALKRDFPQLVEKVTPVLIGSAVRIWAAYYDSPQKERAAVEPQIKAMAAFCWRHYKAASKELQLGFAGQLILRLTPYAKGWAFALAHGINYLYEQKHGRPM